MDNCKYGHILSFVTSTPWALMVDKLAIIMDLIAFRAEGGILSDEEIAMRIGAVARPQQRQAGAIAVLPLYGTISPRANMMSESSGGTSIERFTQQFRQAMADPAIGGIILDVDSPGGAVTGVEELASEIYNARGVKPIAAIANSLAASAAYWLGTAAEELSVTPSGEVGSIGVYAAHEDLSGMMERRGVKTTLISAGKFKTEGSPFAPLDDEAKAAIQERVDDYYGMFTSAVAMHRGVSASDVRGGFGEGRVVGAKRAKSLGMVDHVETMDDVITRMMRRVKKGASGTAAKNGPIIVGDHLLEEGETIAGELAKLGVGESIILAEVPEGEEMLITTETLLDLRRRRLKLAGR